MNQALIPVTIERSAVEAEGICTIELVAAGGGELPAFAAGAHIDVHVNGLVRQYSLCNAANERHRYVIGVLRDPASRGGSVAMHGLVRHQQILIGPPRNHFPLVDGAHPSLLLAGGIGITPILAMARVLDAQERSYELHYCTRNLARTAFTTTLNSLGGTVLVHHDEGDAAQKFDVAATLAGCSADTHLYVCGPTGFMDHVIAAAQAAGWSAQRIHSERFGARAQAPSDETAFEVCIASTGQRHWVPEGVSITDVLRMQGIEIPVSCEQGVCGTCLTRVVSGQPDHRDVFLTDKERASNDCMTPCCSRALSRSLTLDL